MFFFVSVFSIIVCVMFGLVISMSGSGCFRLMMVFGCVIYLSCVCSSGVLCCLLSCCLLIIRLSVFVFISV